MKILFLVFTFFIFCLLLEVNQSNGQERSQSLEKISLKIKESNAVKPNFFYIDVTVNSKFPKYKDVLKVEQSHGDIWQIYSSAIVDKENSQQSILKVKLIYIVSRSKTKIIQKNFKLKKGQIKKFRLNHKSANYEITASY